MSELTNERLEEYARDGRNAGDCEVEQMARELLALRTLRDAGDEEVEQMKGMIRKCIYGIPDSEGKIARDMLDNIVDIAITRGQQLREAREEIERLKSRKIECCTCGHEMAEVDGQFGCEHCDHEYDGTCECWQCHHSREHESMQSQITTLTAERDEAIRIKNEILQDAKREITGLRDGVEKDLAELAALKSAPGMEEVDALVAKEDSLSAKMSAGHYLLFINACDLARRSTASREEVVGLLKESVKMWDKIDEIREWAPESPFYAKLLKIVEGK